MDKMLKSYIFVIALFYLYSETESSPEVMKTMSEKFGEAINVCKAELSLPDTIFEDFNNYWKPDYELKHRETGCAVHCLASKLNLIDPTGKLHHGNAHEFAKQHGADDAMAQQLIDLVHKCHESTPPNDDVCLKVLDTSKCFKMEINKLNWTPNFDVAMADLVSEA